MRKFFKNTKNVGTPEKMRDYLLALTKESPWMLIFFGKDINRLDEEAQKAAEEEERRMEREYEAQNPCFSCPLGNGMGRCGSQLPLECEELGRI